MTGEEIVLCTEIATLRTRVAELEAALRPLAELTLLSDQSPITTAPHEDFVIARQKRIEPEHVKAARAALSHAAQPLRCDCTRVCDCAPDFRIVCVNCGSSPGLTPTPTPGTHHPHHEPPGTAP